MYRVRKGAMIGGVCTGLGKALSVDPILFRLAFILAVCYLGIGILPYALMWLLLPEQND